VLEVREGVVVRRRLDRRCCPRPRRATVARRAGAGRKHRLPPPAERVAELDARREPVDLVERAGVAVEQERLVVVVHREGPARLQVTAHLAHRLRREEVVLEPQARLPGEQRQRVREREEDQVVFAVGALDERAPVVHVRVDARVLVRMIRVVAPPEVLELRVDLDRVDPPRSLRERDRDVVAVPGADDQHVVQRPPGEMPVREEVEALDLLQRLDRVRRLVRDVVDGDDERPVRADAGDRGLARRVDGGDLVVRRPALVRRGGLDREQCDDADQGGCLPPAQPPAQQPCEDGRRDRPPRDRRQAQERERGEADDPGDAAEDVEPVRLERAEAHERPRDAVADRARHRDDEQEDDHEARPARQRRDPPAPVQLVRPLEGDERDREEQDEADEQRERERREAKEVGAAVGAQEPEPDPEEAREQDEVRQVGEVDVVRRRPADERELDEQHQEAERDEARPQGDVRTLGRPRLRRRRGGHDPVAHPRDATSAPAEGAGRACDRPRPAEPRPGDSPRDVPGIATADRATSRFLAPGRVRLCRIQRRHVPGTVTVPERARDGHGTIAAAWCPARAV